MTRVGEAAALERSRQLSPLIPSTEAGVADDGRRHAQAQTEEFFEVRT